MRNLPTARQLTLSVLFAFMTFPSIAASPLTCHVSTEEIETVKKRLLQDEGMIPVTSHFRNVGTDDQASWAMATVMMNPSTKEGYEWVRVPQGFVCIAKKYSSIELMSNTSFRAQSFVDLRTYPNADDVSDGASIASGINTRLITLKNRGMNPMYRAIVDAYLDLTQKSDRKYIGNLEFLVSHPTTKAGILLSASSNGTILGNFTRVAGVPETDGVKFGAIYSPAAEQMLGLQGR